IESARRVLSHLRELADAGAGVLLITHDLELACEFADRIAVFYAGETIEEAGAADFMREKTLRHPYTRSLWRAMPEHGFEAPPQMPADTSLYESGCAYRACCAFAMDACAREFFFLHACPPTAYF
ncbi:MAG: ABC transporter ATP-binding protein, partial [Ruthenibacterium sp.]